MHGLNSIIFKDAMFKKTTTKKHIVYNACAVLDISCHTRGTSNFNDIAQETRDNQSTTHAKQPRRIK